MTHERPIKFRVYADPARRYYAEVSVYKSVRSMRIAINAGRPKRLHTIDAAANVRSYIAKKNGKISGVFARIWFCRYWLDKRAMEIIAHESVHAAARYFERRGWVASLDSFEPPHRRHLYPDTEYDYEERFAYAVGRIARQINRGLHKHKIV